MTARRLAAEFLGTAGLLLAIVGSGITASADGAASAQLLQHAIVVGAALAALILTFGPVSGAHFNPAVTLVDAIFGGMQWRMAAGYIISQIAGAVFGVVATNLLFGMPAIDIAGTDRTGLSAAASEAVATFGLLVVIFGVVRSGRGTAAAFAVGGYIAGAYYFTSSTSFANPAVTIGRAFTDTFAGIAPGSVAPFVIAQGVGGLVALGLLAVLYPDAGRAADDVVVPQGAPALVTEGERPDLPRPFGAGHDNNAWSQEVR